MWLGVPVSPRTQEGRQAEVSVGKPAGRGSERDVRAYRLTVCIGHGEGSRDSRRKVWKCEISWCLRGTLNCLGLERLNCERVEVEVSLEGQRQEQPVY